MQPIQDTVQFALRAEEVITNTTVRINATVVALVTPELTEQMLKDSIREVMARFITADWQFSNMTRQSHAAGLEQVNLVATARVPESENYALERRRQEASREGLTISAVTTDTSPPMSQVEMTRSLLRAKLIGQAREELLVINAAADDTYRLGAVVFDPDEDWGVSNRAMALSSSAPKTSYGSGFGGGGSTDIGNAVKLTMTANIELRINR